MSSITGLISAGGGGGGASHILTDPQKMAKFMYDANIEIKDGVNGTTNTGSATFWSQSLNDDSVYRVATASDDTYVTLVDITSATNGGYLWWVISNVMRNTYNQSSYIRITVDGGTPVEFSATVSTADTVNRRFVIGSGIAAGKPVESSSSIVGNYFSSLDSGGLFSASNYHDSSESIYYGGGIYGYIIDNFSALHTLPYERLYFESSLKIEVKQQTYFTGGIGYAAYSRVTLL